MSVIGVVFSSVIRVKFSSVIRVEFSSVIRVEFSNLNICMLLMMSELCEVFCFVDAATNVSKSLHTTIPFQVTTRSGLVILQVRTRYLQKVLLSSWKSSGKRAITRE